MVAVAVAVLAGCGGGEQAATTEARPTIPAATANELAAKSEQVADALDAGDVCTAAVRADELLDAVTLAIEQGRVPAEFQEELTSTANALVNEVNCPEPEPTETETTEDEDEKKKDKDKKDKDDDEDVLTVITEDPTTAGPGE